MNKYLLIPITIVSILILFSGIYLGSSNFHPFDSIDSLINNSSYSFAKFCRFFAKIFNKIEIPTCIAVFPAEMLNWPPRSYAERIYNIQHWTEMPRGGHFAAMEEPRMLIEDIRKFSRSIHNKNSARMTDNIT